MRFFTRCFGLSCVCILLVWVTNATAVSERDAKLISILESGGYEKIKLVAQQIHDEEIFSVPVLDTLAAVVYQSYEVPDLRVVDSLSWGCRVLGESGRYRYQNLVDEIGRLAPNMELREYCSEAAQTISDARQSVDILPEDQLQSDEMSMKPIWYPGHQVPAQHVSYRVYPQPLRKKMMKRNIERIETISTGSKKRVTQELKRILADQGKTPFEVNEAAAQIIWNFVEDNESLSEDTVARACEALSVSRSDRYHDLVYSAILRGQEKSDVIAEHCSIAYDDVSDDSDTEQFTPAYLLTQDFREEPEDAMSDLSIIKQRLSLLKQQHSKGLIDKQTYDIKREAILANL